MKLSLSVAVLAALTSFSAFANEPLPSGVVFQREGPYLEYPAAYKTKSAVTVKLSANPGPNEAKTIDCQIPKDKRIIFARAKFVVTQTTQTAKLQAKNEFDLQYDNYRVEPVKTETVLLQKGEIVEDLSYYAEGNCVIKIRDVEADGSCLSNDSDQSKFTQLSELKLESSVKIISCLNGTTGWLSESQMESNSAFESFMYNPY